MKIIKLEAKNVLRLDAVEITPEGNLVVIGGMNEQGKTSVLDSIFLALGGRLAKHKKPLKEGAKKGNAIIDLGDLKVIRTFTKNGGGTLKVTNSDGAVYPSPQTILDNLVGRLTFDPLAWVRMEDKKQLETLKQMVGLDFTELDERRQELYSERTGVNNEGKRLRGAFDSMPEYPDAPEEEVLVTELMIALEQEEKRTDAKKEAKNSLLLAQNELSRQKAAREQILDEIKRLEQSLKMNGRDIERLMSKIPEIERQIAEMPDGAEQEIKDKIAGAEEINAQVRANRDREIRKTQLEKARKESKSLTEQIEEIDQKRIDLMANAEFPIESMSFDENGVLYKGIPFSQCSSAEQLRVSVAMGIAMNPKLKVLLIRDGSMLDDNNLKMVADIAETADCQVWLERVGKGKECQVIIEDGKRVQ